MSLDYFIRTRWDEYAGTGTWLGLKAGPMFGQERVSQLASLAKCGVAILRGPMADSGSSLFGLSYFPDTCANFRFKRWVRAFFSASIDTSVADLHFFGPAIQVRDLRHCIALEIIRQLTVPIIPLLYKSYQRRGHETWAIQLDQEPTQE